MQPKRNDTGHYAVYVRPPVTLAWDDEGLPPLVGALTLLAQDKANAGIFVYRRGLVVDEAGCAEINYRVDSPSGPGIVQRRKPTRWAGRVGAMMVDGLVVEEMG